MRVQLAILAEAKDEAEQKENESVAELFDLFLQEREDKLHGKDGVSRTPMHKYARKVAKFVISTKDLGMGLVRIDTYRIAPIVMGGIYCIAAIVEGATEEQRKAIDTALDMASLITYWDTIEELQIRTNANLRLTSSYKQLEVELIKMYKAIIVLMVGLTSFLRSKMRTFIKLPFIVRTLTV